MEKTAMEHAASHSVTCNAPADRVYGLIRRSRDWPQVMDPCESVTVLEESEGFEHIEIGARVNGQLMKWQSRRRILPELLGVEATIVRPMKLVEAMRTTWRVVALSTEQSVLVLEHEYDLSADVTGQVDGVATREDATRYIETAIDRNSTVELGNLKAAAERTDPSAGGPDFHLRHSVVCGAAADTVYDVVRSVQTWPRIFDACVSATELGGDRAGVLVRIEATQDGRVVSWDTRRRYLDDIRRIDYDLPVPMPFLESMRGQWRVVPLGPDRCLLTVDRHWRMLPDVAGIRPGIDTVAQAAAFVRRFVSGNAEAEMRSIQAFVEDKTDALTSLMARFPLPFAPDRVFAALADVSLWPDAVPGRRAREVRYDDRRHQELLAQWDTPAGAEDVRVVRHCDPGTATITYVFPEPLAILLQHRGGWQVRAAGAGSEVVATPVAVLDTALCAKAFGTDDLRTQKARVRALLEADCRATVDACLRALQGGPTGNGDGRG
jgi:ribosome-associated toxin RatA of RatAB toxin-antitoxin module